MTALPVLGQVPLTSSDLRLPSDGAGEGTIAVRLTYPANAASYRYPCGAPVVVYLPGGFGAGNLPAGQRIAEQGFVVVTFVYPGGVTPQGSSDGIYDYRGENCQRALRDVLRFAEGAATDSLGRTIGQIVPGPVHQGIVGLAPYSNGLIGLVTLARHGGSIPYAPYQSGWENPTSGQIVTGDLGTIGEDCDASLDTDGNGLPGDDARNPWYDPATGYGSTSFVVSYARLAYDPLLPAVYADPVGRCAPVSRPGAIFLDGRVNGRVDFRPGSTTCLDYDGDGVHETSEDWRFRGITTFDAACNLKLAYSSEVTEAAAAANLFPAGWPSWLATPQEAAAFWDLRDPTRHWDEIAQRFPGFRAMSVFAVQDHVQSQPDHPHVRQVLDGMSARGLWHRLNADATYFASVTGSLPPGYVETPAGAPVPLGQMKQHGEPRGTRSDDMQAAGHSEMADRLHSGCWWPDLDGLLRSPIVPDGEVGSLVFRPDKTTLEWPAAAGAFCYDLLRGGLEGLAEDGERVTLGAASCAGEDSPLPRVTDPTVPAAGRGFYYVVKPNGTHGGYGASSEGRPRIDAARACRN